MPQFKNENVKTGIALSGGGVRGIAHIGVLKALHEFGIYPSIVSGVSAGAIFGSFLTIGYKSNEIDTIIKNMNFKEYLNITADSIINFMRLKGLDSGKNIMTIIKKCIKDKTGDENITFSQIQAQFNINLKIEKIL
jgi:predicted acylesterase/phospholipase RssA